MGELCGACAALLALVFTLAIMGPPAFWLGYRRGYRGEKE